MLKTGVFPQAQGQGSMSPFQRMLSAAQSLSQKYFLECRSREVIDRRAMVKKRTEC
jgi:hypothetical protein